MQKLKQENDALREALEQARAADIALLKTRLRAAQADIIHYKQLNSELKGRIQTLEEKLFKILSDQYERDTDSSTSGGSVSQMLKEKLRQKNLASQLGFPHHSLHNSHGSEVDSQVHNEIEDTDDPHQRSNSQGSTHNVKLTDGVKASYVTLQNRCRHFESLSASCEKKIKMLEVSCNAACLLIPVEMTWAYSFKCRMRY